MLEMQTQSSSQGINYYRIFVDGSHHKIHLRIIISHATPITRDRRPGFSKELCTRNGSQRVPNHYSGFMGNVCPCPILPPDPTNKHPLFAAGSGKSILWFVEPSLLSSMIIESLVFLQFYYHRRCESHVRCWSSLDGILLFRFSRHQQTTLA